MNAIKNIRKQIQNIPQGQPFSASLLQRFVTPDNLRQILARLAKMGELTRITRGVFMRPIRSSYIAQEVFDAHAVVEAIAKRTGEKIAIHGAEAARILQLTTQVPMRTIYLTTGHTRNVKVGNMEIIFKHTSPRKLVKPGTTLGLVISALWYLGKNHVNTSVIEKIKNQIQPEEFSELLEYSSHMPAWMAKAFYIFKSINNVKLSEKYK